MDGLCCEFGVADGHTIRYCAAQRPLQLFHGFDSFRGLPARWRDGWEAGEFACAVPEVPVNVRLHQGWFAQTIPPFLETSPLPLAFVHIDCDLGSSARTVLELMNERIVAGTVIVFDEFFNYPFWQNNEARAWRNFVDQHLRFRGLNFEYLSYNKFGEQVALQIR